jgi:hypothetical protein
MLLCPKKNSRNASENGIKVKLKESGIAAINIKAILPHLALLFLGFSSI